MTARPIVADWFPICGLGFARTDFGLPPPPSPPFLQAIAKPSYLPAWMWRANRFSSAAIIFFQAADGRHPSHLTFVRSVDLAVCCDGQNLLFAREQEAAHSRQIFEASWVGCESRRGSSCSENCTRVYLLNNQPRYFRKTKRPVWERKHGPLHQALMQESAL